MSPSSKSKKSFRLPGLPLRAEDLVQSILLLGFFVLLLLVAAIGYWSRESFKILDEEIVILNQSEFRHLRIVLKISETAGIMWNEASTMLANEESNLMHRTAITKLNDLKKVMEEQIRIARNTRLLSSPGWAEFESSFSEYWKAIHANPPTDWTEQRGRMEKAIISLEAWTDREREQNERQARALSLSKRNRVIVSTVVAILVGLLVAGLTFYEIRRTLNRLSKAYRLSAESRDYLQSLFDGLVSGVVVVDRDGAIQTVSGSFTSLTGLSRDAVLHQRYWKLFEGKEHLIDNISRQLASDPEEGRYLGRIEMGKEKLFDIFASPLSISGEYRGLILVFMDITETERAQSELRRNRALAAVGQMTAQIAHEIKNPLGSIRFAAELIKRRPTADAESRETIEIIDRSVDHLTSIVAELSEFARPKELNLSKTNLNELLEELTPMLADRLADKGLDIVKAYNAGLPPGRFDKTELRKLFLNLIINAIDASEPGSKIMLRTGLDGKDMVQVEIQDEGSGMDGETLSRLFEPFYTTKKAGTGLGMAISKKIAELHRGDLLVSSKLGTGTKVTVRLPID
jgi:two-component system nitrogen regulation sensor histidine kinase GlnL